MDPEKTAELIDTAIAKGREIERDRCVMLIRLAYEESCMRNQASTWFMEKAIERIEHPKG